MADKRWKPKGARRSASAVNPIRRCVNWFTFTSVRFIERVMGELLPPLVFPLLKSPFLNPASPAALAQKRRARLPSSDRCAGASAVLARNCTRTSTLDRPDVLFFQIILSMIDYYFHILVLNCNHFNNSTFHIPNLLKAGTCLSKRKSYLELN